MEQHTAEVWVKVISIVGIVLAAIGALVGLIILLGGSFLGSFVGAILPGAIGGMFGALFAVLGIVVLIVSAFEIYLYIQLGKYVNWARIVVLVFTGLGTLGALISLIGGSVPSILGLIIDGGIFYLLAFQKEIVALFNK